MTTITEGRGSGQIRSWSDLDQGIERGRDLQAQALSRALRRMAGAAWRLARGWRGATGRRAETHLLLGLSDRMLADIGLQRADVQGMAYGVIPLPRSDDGAELAGCAAIVPMPERRRCLPAVALDAAA